MSVRRRSPCCARPSASSTRAARCACATRRAASCARLGARAETRGPASRRRERGRVADEARARDRHARHRPQDEPRDRRRALPQRQDVESHMRHIFHKLGVSSRVEVARAIEHERRERDGAHGRELVAAPPLDPDAARLAELGYRQELVARASLLRQRRDGLRRDLARRRALRRRARRHRRGRARHGCGCCRSRSPASVCCSRCTPSSPRSFRSPAARTSGAAG